MEPAGIAVIGGAVGAAGTLAASVLTQLLGQRASHRDRADEREQAAQDRWFGERRQLYLDLIEFATEAHEASQELAYSRKLTDDRKDEITKEMRATHSNFWSRETKVLLLGSDALLDHVGRFGLRILEVERLAKGELEEDAHSVYDRTRGSYEALVNVVRDDLGIGPLKPPGLPTGDAF